MYHCSVPNNSGPVLHTARRWWRLGVCHGSPCKQVGSTTTSTTSRRSLANFERIVRRFFFARGTDHLPIPDPWSEPKQPSVLPHVGHPPTLKKLPEDALPLLVEEVSSNNEDAAMAKRQNPEASRNRQPIDITYNDTDSLKIGLRSTMLNTTAVTTTMFKHFLMAMTV